MRFYDYKEWTVMMKQDGDKAYIQVMRHGEFMRGAWVDDITDSNERFKLECEKVRLEYRLAEVEIEIGCLQ